MPFRQTGGLHAAFLLPLLSPLHTGRRREEGKEAGTFFSPGPEGWEPGKGLRGEAGRRDIDDVLKGLSIDRKLHKSLSDMVYVLKNHKKHSGSEEAEQTQHLLQFF